MQMMNVLKPIAFDVVICMSQLFDYYLFAVSITFLCYEQHLYQILFGKNITQTTAKTTKGEKQTLFTSALC